MTNRRIGRRATFGPPNRYERLHTETDDDETVAFESEAESPAVRTEFLPDDSKTLITEADSPDVPFRYSVNPYRGCEHGCAYCYARPYHEYVVRWVTSIGRVHRQRKDSLAEWGCPVIPPISPQ